MKNFLAKPLWTKAVPILLMLLFVIYWAWLVYSRSILFSYGMNDAYQYSSPFALQTAFMNFKLPLLGNFPPFSEGWGLQWPFYMVLKSALYSLIPYTVTTDKLLALAIVLVGGFLMSYVVSLSTRSVWQATFSLMILMSEVNVIGMGAVTRAEPITLLVLLLLLVAVDRMALPAATLISAIACTLSFFLLPGLHPHGLTLCGGLALLHLVFFKELFPTLNRKWRFLPLAAYGCGIAGLYLFFQVAPVAGEQMSINSAVQKIIYSTASRYTFFQNYLKTYPFGIGFLLWIPALLYSGWILCLAFYQKFSTHSFTIRPGIFYAAAIVIALPILGFIFRIDNYYHFCIGVPAAIYLLTSSNTNLPAKLAFRGKLMPVYFGIVAFGMCSILAGRGWRYIDAGRPDLPKELTEIFANYTSARKIYIPVCLWEVAIQAAPQRSFFYRYPLPMLKEWRRQYEKTVFSDCLRDDILMVNRLEILPDDRLLSQPIGQYDPPDLSSWELIGQHTKLQKGSTPWGWDLYVYRKK